LQIARRLGRQLELDATRGVAMLAVCLSHSAGFVGDQWQDSFGALLVTMGLLATPTFLLLSGMVYGQVETALQDASGEFRWRMVDRGLFLLLVAHLLLALEQASWSPPLLTAYFSSFYVTDAIGLSLIIGVVLARRFTPRMLALLGLLVFVSAWMFSNREPPRDSAGRNLTRLLFGVYDPLLSDVGFMVPLVPYLAIFIIGIAGGILYARLRALSVTTAALSRACVAIGGAGIAVAVTFKLVWLLGKPPVDSSWYVVLYHLTEPRQKVPPGPGYLLAFGGAGVLLLGMALRYSQREMGRRIVSVFAVVGRASLFIFVAQYMVYYFPTYALHIGKGSWLYSFPASVVALWGLAWIWDRHHGNRFLTIGIRRMHSWYSDTAPRRVP
jgi:uncharacterized membrane protein